MKPSAADVLVALTEGDGVELFHSPDGKVYATITVNGHRETWPVRSKRFAGWLRSQYYLLMNKAAPAQATAEVLALSEARALNGSEMSVHVRVAGDMDRIYLDLADSAWRVVEIDASGWRVRDDSPIKFHRAAGTLALPAPQRGGSLDELRGFINVSAADERNLYRMLVHWLVMTLRPRGPYPLLGLFGEQGSAKSTASRVLRELVDPNAAPLRSEPREPRDLMIAAERGWMIALDNISHLPSWLSDALCRLSTGGGFSTRELFTDSEEVIFSSMRPVVVNGIEEVITRGDLMQRAILIELPTITREHRRTEAEFWRDFEAKRPGMFGALLAAVAGTIKAAPDVRLPAMQRMADFSEWSVATERGLGWPAGAFLAAYDANIASAHELVLDASPIAQALRALVADAASWEGLVTELLKALADRVDESTKRAKTWPRSPKGLAGALRRLGPNLRAVGIDITFGTRTKRGQPVCVKDETFKVGKSPTPRTPATPPASIAGSTTVAGVAGVRGVDHFPTLNAPSERTPAEEEAEL